MTTAHRPTWAPARGGEEQGGLRLFVASRARSAKDQPAQLTLKFRQGGQAARGDLEGRDLKAELEAKEREHQRKTKGVDFEGARWRRWRQGGGRWAVFFFSGYFSHMWLLF